MRIIHLSTSDYVGGAARATYRLHCSLRIHKVDSRMLVQEKTQDDWTVYGPDTEFKQLFASTRRLLEKIPIRLYPGRLPIEFNFAYLPGGGVLKEIHRIKPDIINLHWIARGLISIENIRKLDIPIVWTLHDMWSFTGGCHIDGGCGKYRDKCGACPGLKSHNDIDLTRITWYRKHRVISNLNLVLVTPSKWLSECVKQSSLFNDQRVEVIPHGLDLKVFNPINKQFAREILNLPQDKRIVLFGSLYPEDPNKGFQILSTAMRLLGSQFRDDRNILLAILGSNAPERPEQFPFPCHYFGKIYDNSTLALIYSAADLTVLPSFQEAYGLTIAEAFACGTPAVAFDATGPKDIIDHQQNGYLANPYKPEDLAKGINWVLVDNDRHMELSKNARKKAELNFSLDLQAKRYLKLYNELVSAK